MRLVTGGHVKMVDLDNMTLDDVDDLNITLDAEQRAIAAYNKQKGG